MLYEKASLRENCPNMEFFLVRIFLYSCIYSVNLRIQSETEKYASEKTPFWDTFHAEHHFTTFSFYHIQHLNSNPTNKYMFKVSVETLKKVQSMFRVNDKNSRTNSVK